MREPIHIQKDVYEIPAIYALLHNNVIEGITVYAVSRNKFLDRDSTSVAKMPLKVLENPQAYTSINQQIMKEQLTYDISEVLKMFRYGKNAGKLEEVPGDGSFTTASEVFLPKYRW